MQLSKADRARARELVAARVYDWEQSDQLIEEYGRHPSEPLLTAIVVEMISVLDSAAAQDRGHALACDSLDTVQLVAQRLAAAAGCSCLAAVAPLLDRRGGSAVERATQALILARLAQDTEASLLPTMLTLWDGPFAPFVIGCWHIILEATIELAVLEGGPASVRLVVERAASAVALAAREAGVPVEVVLPQAWARGLP
jgi:hypothetical protein